MIKVRIERVKGSSFKGYVEVADLTETQLETLGLTRDTDELSVDVEGDFSVGGSSDDIQIIELSCYAVNGLNDLELNDENADMDDLAEQIRDNADEAYLDHMVAMGDWCDSDWETV